MRQESQVRPALAGELAPLRRGLQRGRLLRGGLVALGGHRGRRALLPHRGGRPGRGRRLPHPVDPRARGLLRAQGGTRSGAYWNAGVISYMRPMSRFHFSRQLSKPLPTSATTATTRTTTELMCQTNSFS